MPRNMSGPLSMMYGHIDHDKSLNLLQAKLRGMADDADVAKKVIRAG